MRRENCFNLFWVKTSSEFCKQFEKEYLIPQGYKRIPDRNGGDDDFIVVDMDRREYIYCESGFFPFCDQDYCRNGKATLYELEKLRH